MFFYILFIMIQFEVKIKLPKIITFVLTVRPKVPKFATILFWKTKDLCNEMKRNNRVKQLIKYI